MNPHGHETQTLVGARGAEPGLTLGELVRILASRWQLILGLVLAGAALAVGLSLLVTPIYRSSVLIAPSVRDTAVAGGLANIVNQIGSLSSLAGEMGLGASATRKDVWIATLRSRELARMLIARDQMMPELFHSRWDAVTKTWKPPRFGGKAEPTPDDAVELLLDKVLSITEDKRTGLVTVSVDWRDSELAARWANDLVALANAEIRTSLIDENQRSVAFLEKELEKTRVVAREQIIHRLVESRMNESMLINARADYAFTVIDPATPSDKDRRFRPQRLRYALIGSLLGLLAATMVILVSMGRPRS